MADQGWRRSGFSRRAQLGAFVGLVLSVLAIIAGAVLLVRSVYGNDDASGARGVALDVTAPIATAIGAPFRWAAAGINLIDDHFRTVSRNRILEKQLDQAVPELVRARALKRENARLKALLDLSEPNPRVIASGRIIGGSPSSPSSTAILSAGTGEGVAVGQPVREPSGLVGRVIETGRHASRVMLLTHVDSRVPVAMVRDGTPALVVGRNDALLEIRTVISDRNPFRPGDLLITSGAGGIYPPDIAVAVVVKPTVEGALARPAVSPEKLGFVIVEEPFVPKITPVIPPRKSATSP
jgi:rod shape-determining protein MreC